VASSVSFFHLGQKQCWLDSKSPSALSISGLRCSLLGPLQLQSATSPSWAARNVGPSGSISLDRVLIVVAKRCNLPGRVCSLCRTGRARLVLLGYGE
jgi:hypothetical protein